MHSNINVKRDFNRNSKFLNYIRNVPKIITSLNFTSMNSGSRIDLINDP